MKIRTFQGGDIDALVACWNRALPHDTVLKSHFIKKVLLDVNFDGEGLLIAEDASGIRGFVSCVRRRVPMDAYAGMEEGDGWISAFAVDAREEFEEISNALLDRAEDYFRAHGKRRISTGYYPVYLFQGFSQEHCPAYTALLEKRGYSYYASLARDLILSRYTVPDDLETRVRRLKAEGYYIGAFKDEYICSLVDAREEFNSSCGACEFKLRLMDLDYDRIWVAAKEGHLVGVCTFGDPYGSPERFGPFVVAPSHQGKGIGGVLMHLCLGEMKKRGLHAAWMQWTPTKGAAHAMYQKVGFQTTKTYLTFSKTL